MIKKNWLYLNKATLGQINKTLQHLYKNSFLLIHSIMNLPEFLEKEL